MSLVDAYPPVVQRPALLALARALGSRDKALRRDECGDWTIKGHFGHIYAVPLDGDRAAGFLIIYSSAQESARAWGFAKNALQFCKLAQDGDFDGTFVLDRLPTPAEAKVIRDKLGIAKKKILSDEHRQKLIKAAQRTRLAVTDGKLACAGTKVAASGASALEGL